MLDADKINLLLTEYKVCQESVRHQDSIAWTIGGFVFTAMLFGIYQISTNAGNEIVESILSLFAILFLWTWYKIYRRWGSFVEIAQYRMQEIEKELDCIMRKNLYVDYLDKQNALYEELNDELKAKFDMVKSKLGYRFSRKPIHQSVKYLLYIITFCWLTIIIYNTYLIICN